MAYEGFHALTAHANYVTITTSSRSNFIFDSDLVAGNVRFSLNKTTATSYQVRNYDGVVVASGGAPGSTLDIPDSSLRWRGNSSAYGWYRLYLFGPDLGTGWGTAYGDCCFYRVSTDSRFPTNPSTATGGTYLNGADEIAHGVMGMGPARYNGDLSKIIPWSTNYATATGTSVSVTSPGGAIGGPGTHIVATHVFIGDPSELAEPTEQNNNGSVVWSGGYGQLVARVTKNTLTISVWHGNPDVIPNNDWGNFTFSSGSKSGTHYVYFQAIRNVDWSWAGWPNQGPVGTASGTGTTASATTGSASFPAGRQKMVYAFVATATGTTFGAFPAGYSDLAFSRTYPGTQPAAPNSIMSVQTKVTLNDVSETPSVSWTGSKDWVMVAWSVLADAANSLPSAGTSLQKTWYNDYALTNRPRKNVVLFPDGIHSRTSMVATAVSTLQPDGVVFEPFNEPVYSLSVADYINYEQAPFYNAAIAADATARILAPANVSFNQGGGGISWVNAWFAAGGAAYCTDISVHDYNCSNGDLSLRKRTLQALVDLRAAYSATAKPLWQTEQGHASWYAGQFWPRYAGRWTALQFFVSEMYGIPVERNSYWYDQNVGFDNFPMYWLQPEGPGPQALPLRTQVAEIGSRTFTAQLDFNKASELYVGGTWTGNDGSKTVGFMAASYGQPSVRFVTNAPSLVTVDCWGNTTTIAAVGGFVTVPSSEMGVWIRVPNGSTCTLSANDWAWGTNACLTGTASTTAGQTVPVSQVIDNNFENVYEYSSSSLGVAGASPWNDTARPTTFPKNVTVTFGAVRSVERFVINCIPPWQYLTTLTDFDLQAQAADDSWSTIYTFSPPTSTSFYFKSKGRCTAETYYSQQSTWIYKPTTPVTCKAMRLVVRGTSYGPHESTIYNNNGQVGDIAGAQQILMVREMQAFYGGATPDTGGSSGFSQSRTSGAILLG